MSIVMSATPQLKIAIATSFPRDPAAPCGGVEAVSVNLVTGLARLPGLTLDVVSFHTDICDPEVMEWHGARIHSLPAAYGSLLRFATGRGRQQLRDYLQRLSPDVVHAHDTYGIMAQDLPIPRVFTVHGFIYEDTRYGGGLGNWLRSRLWRHVEVGGWQSQPRIISISPYVRERLAPLVAGIIYDIENPISADCFEVRSALDEPNIFSSALICRRKNTIGLVRAFARLRHYGLSAQLRLAGKISEPEYGRELQGVIRELQLESDIQLLGPISAAAVRDELQRAAVFALLSFEEGAPMGIAEAMAAGIPVVTSNRCGMPYMVRHGESGFLVDPTDPDAAGAAFHQLLQDSVLRKKLGLQARIDAASRYHPDRVAERTLAVYRVCVPASVSTIKDSNCNIAVSTA
jgi:glycosyltransferase involved in cell wall biosynthesis